MLPFVENLVDSVSLAVTQLQTVGPFHIIFGLLCVHALVTNILFGHPTYWRQPLPKRTSSSDKLALFCSCKKWDLERVHPDLLLQIFGYLNPQELTVIAQVSKPYNNMSRECSLWSDLILRIPARLREQHAECFIEEIAIHRYFKILHLIASTILADDDKIIIRVHGDLFDLTHFAPEHPGGMAILEDYQGGDGTRIFDLAKHSEFARDLMLNLVVFSHAEYTGSLGLPNFARRLLAESV